MRPKILWSGVGGSSQTQWHRKMVKDLQFLQMICFRTSNEQIRKLLLLSLMWAVYLAPPWGFGICVTLSHQQDPESRFSTWIQGIKWFSWMFIATAYFKFKQNLWKSHRWHLLPILLNRYLKQHKKVPRCGKGQLLRICGLFNDHKQGMICAKASGITVSVSTLPNLLLEEYETKNIGNGKISKVIKGE